MGYQALLFCPDEKLARSVTQVLSELEFAVVPCTEPFAAVKKMMVERFDAVVVDCDNEQNATLLFKSAHSSPNNQSSLAVAVVEGQAGVAKAFRIGANLVLTKPINVEQAKGTLRVARGLLRKNEAAKSPGATGTLPLKSSSAFAPEKPAPQVVNTVAGPSVAPMAPVASVPPNSAVPRRAAPVAVAKASVPAPIDVPEADVDILDDGDEVASPAIASPVSTQPVPVVASSSPVSAKAEPAKRPADTKPASAFGTGTATAPAPAREEKSASSAQQKKSLGLAPGKNSVEAGRDVELSPKTEPAEPPVSPTSGEAVGGETKTAKSGNKNLILSAAAVVLLAAAGYEAWMQWGHPSAASSPAPHPVSHAPAPAPQPTEPAAATPPAASLPPAPVAGVKSIPAPQPPTTKASDKPSASSVSTHKSKTNDEAEETVSSPAVSETKTEQPIVIKSGAAKAKSATSDAPAPNLEGITVANASPLPNLMVSESKTPAPVLQSVHVSQGVAQGILLKRVPPVYPPNALRLRIEGAVQLIATISPAGNVTAVKVVSGDALLAHAAADAVKQWKYKPYLLDGTPIETEKPITVEFKLPR